ncbi:MAG TPA: CpcT/CpeT family chromophore lyase [Phycisphaerales bacterium]|nr:CpcT/CpeT family chromophore lyase [Phycisphaerales bacterium]
MATRIAIACGLGVLALSAPLLAQPGETPAVRAARPCPGDRETIDALKAAISHVFVAEPRGDQPELVMHVTPVRIDDLADAMLVEIARADALADPFRMYVLQLYDRQGALRLRTYELPPSPGLKEALANLWGAPESLSLMEASSLAPSLDMPVIDTPRAGRTDEFSAKTEHPFPVNRGGAIEMTAGWSLAGPVLEMTDAGFDAAGKRVWGSDEPIRFALQPQAPDVRREGEGLTIITTVPAPSDAPRLRPASEGGGELVIQFTYWTSTGQKIDTSRKPGRDPVKVRIPGGTPFPALDTALAGIAKGERRKIIVPPALAYGATGRGTVPPNATLIYDIECLGVDNSSQSAPTKSPRSAPPPGLPGNPHAPGPPAPAAPRGDEPIGSPPTNGTPETPR